MPLLILQGLLVEELQSLDDWEWELELDILRSYKRDWLRLWEEVQSELFRASYEEN